MKRTLYTRPKYGKFLVGRVAEGKRKGEHTQVR